MFEAFEAENIFLFFWKVPHLWYGTKRRAKNIIFTIFQLMGRDSLNGRFRYIKYFVILPLSEKERLVFRRQFKSYVHEFKFFSFELSNLVF